MHFVSEMLDFFPPFTEFSLLAGEFWPWKLHKSMPAPFGSLAALHSRLLSCHPDDRFPFLSSPHHSLFIFPSPSQITS
jgi:hypothetical protein